MTQQNIQNTIESEGTIGDRNNSESQQDSKDRDNRLANPPVEEQDGYFNEYCASNPSASQCRVYDL